ncbi:MAG TPA: RHS repeat-associated core domain-containing protein [Candidatus Limnocylindrales bacterium]|nr:RHS repeat-associated core domain-containing protein [Candidatus Limnocylindrales bacterium]
MPADATATATPGGAAVTTTTTVPGQNAVVSFSGTTGQRIFFSFTNNTYGCCLSTVVRKPDGTTLVSTSISTTGTIDTTTLPATGTYTITFDPSGALIGAVTTQLYDVPADPSTALTINGGAGSVTTTTPGQNAQFAFTGSAGQVVSIALTGNTFGSTTFTVKRPDGSTLASATTSAATHTFSNLTLNVAGGYTIAVNPSGLLTGSVNAAVTSSGGFAQPSASIPIDNELRQRASDDSEAWVPDRFNLAGAGFTSGRSNEDISTVEPLSAPAGVTAVAGRVLAVNGRPLGGVTLRIGERSTRTHSDGRFLLTGVAAGHQAMVIDGTTARRDFGWFEAGVDVLSGQTTVLPYTIWLTRIDTQHAVSFPSPTTAETVITTPLIPGFEVRLPKGARVLDEDHHPVTSLSITAIPVDRPPFPLPHGVETPVYFTVQPGGSYVVPEGAQIVYPNSTHLAPGSTVDFWNYDADGIGWHIYGRGRVTPDGRQIVPNDGVRVYEFTGAMINVGGLFGPGDGPGDDGDNGGDPVDLGTGLFVESHTDLLLPDVIPVGLTRTYRQRDNANRPFGIGTNFSYGIFLQSAHQYTEADLVSPDGGKVHMIRTSAGTGFTDAVFATVETTGPFMNSTMAWNGDGWDLVRPDGLVFVFGENQPLQSIRDRHGNTVVITRASGGQSGNITQVTSPNGRWLAFSYGTGNRVSQVKDNAGRTVSYSYDAAGHLTQVTNPLGHTTQYTYDASHRMTSIVDGRGITYLTNTYDAQSRVATQTTSAGGTYQFAYTTDTAGEITATTVTGPEGTASTTNFDAQHRVADKTVAAGSPLARNLVTQRDPVTHQPTRMVDPYGRATRVTYDAAGRPTAVTALADTPSAKTASATMNGPFGQVTSFTDPAGKTYTYAYHPSGDLASITNPAGRTSSATYNAAGQPLSVTDGSGLTTTFTYDNGDLIATTDPLGNTTRFVIDALGRRVTVVDPVGSSAITEYDSANNITSTVDGLGNTTTVAHDQNGNVTSVTDAQAHTTTFGYDNADRIVSATDPLGKTATRTYDQLGRVTSVTDRRGKKTVSQYDVLGRTTFVGYGAVAGPAYESTIALSYDTLDRLTTIADSAAGTTTLTYDSVDNVASVATPTGTVGYTHDDLGRITGTTVPGQAAIGYTYDDAGQLASITQGGLTATWTRDAAGKVTGVAQPNLTTAYTYNTVGQISSIAYSGPGGASIGDLTYAYDAAGRIASAAGSLARITIPATKPAATYDAADRLITSGATTFTYDDEGNLVGDGARTYTWNARNQLTGVSGPGLTATFGYDPTGRRTSSTINGTARTFLYDGPNLVQEQAGGVPVVNRLTAGTDQTLRQTDSAGGRAPIVDLLGSVIGLVNDGGTVTTSYTYDPYGKVTATGAASTNTQQYTGREYDVATGLQNNRLRYYSPDLGRFISQDPAGFAGGSTNQYLYALGDPVNLSDPNGDCPICAIVVAGIISGGIGVGLGYLDAKLSGRKYTWGDALKDFLIWGTIGAATEGLGLWLRGARTAESVWKLGWSARGFAVEERLGGNLVKNFPTIDKYINGVATSIKSLDLGAPTYQNAAKITSRLKGYIDKLSGFSGNMTWGGDTVGNVTSRVLEVAVPPGGTAAQMSAIQQMIQYGASKGVTVIVHVIP